MLSASAGQAGASQKAAGLKDPAFAECPPPALHGERHTSGRDHSGHAEAADMPISRITAGLRVPWDQLTTGPSSQLVPAGRSWCPGAELPPAHLPSGWVVGAGWPSGLGGAGQQLLPQQSTETGTRAGQGRAIASGFRLGKPPPPSNTGKQDRYL